MPLLGWVPIHRDLLYGQLLRLRANVLRTYVRLLLVSATGEWRVYIGKDSVLLKHGQVFIPSAATREMYPPGRWPFTGNLRPRWLDTLAMHGFIALETNPHGLIVTVLERLRADSIPPALRVRDNPGREQGASPSLPEMQSTTSVLTAREENAQPVPTGSSNGMPEEP